MQYFLFELFLNLLNKSLKSIEVHFRFKLRLNY